MSANSLRTRNHAPVFLMARVAAQAILWMAVFVIGMSTSLTAHEIPRFMERITMLDDGSALVEVRITFGSDSLKESMLPCNFPNVSGLRTPANVPYEASLVSVEGIRQVKLMAGKYLPRECEVSYVAASFFDLKTAKSSAFGNYTLYHRFVNTTSSPIGHYEGEMVLPPGMVVSAVVQSDPELTEKDPVVPYWVGMHDARRTITIRSSNMKLGSAASISFRFKSDSKSPVLFGGLVLVGVLYLVFFRDVLKSPSAKRAAVVNS